MIPNFVNLVLCFAVGVSAMCRLAKMHDGVMNRVALLYVVLFAGSVVSGLRFYLFGTLADWPDVALAAFVAVLLWVTVRDWRKGPPCTACEGS